MGRVGQADRPRNGDKDAHSLQANWMRDLWSFGFASLSLFLLSSLPQRSNRAQEGGADRVGTIGTRQLIRAFRSRDSSTRHQSFDTSSDTTSRSTFSPTVSPTSIRSLRSTPMPVLLASVCFQHLTTTKRRKIPSHNRHQTPKQWWDAHDFRTPYRKHRR